MLLGAQGARLGPLVPAELSPWWLVTGAIVVLLLSRRETRNSDPGHTVLRSWTCSLLRPARTLAKRLPLARPRSRGGRQRTKLHGPIAAARGAPRIETFGRTPAKRLLRSFRNAGSATLGALPLRRLLRRRLRSRSRGPDFRSFGPARVGPRARTRRCPVSNSISTGGRPRDASLLLADATTL